VPVRVVTDSSCDLPQALADELGIVIVPLTVRFGAEERRDRRDLTPTEFWARRASSPDPPETAAPPPSHFDGAYRALSEAGADGIVVVAVSALLSGTVQSAQLAASAVLGVVAVAVVDSRSITSGLGMVALAAAKRALAGGTIEQVRAAAAETASRTEVLIAVEPSDHGRRGGPGGAGAGLAGGGSRTRSVIEVRDGRFEQAGRSRGRGGALDQLVDRVAAAGPLEDLVVFQAEALDLDGFVSRVAPLAPGPVRVDAVGAVLGSRCGPGAMGVAYQRQTQ
jgi:fatty acid kinase fatty acid binding subunit